MKNAHNPVTLIVGCGDVGGRLGTILLAAGHTVYGMRRDVSRLPEGVQPVSGDLTTGELGDWPEHVDYVVYSAAAGRQGEEGYRRIYVDGLKAVLERISQSSLQPRRVFFTSSTAVYHQSKGEWVDELSPTHPENFNGQVMLEAERLLMDFELPATAVRFGGIYGPGRNYMVRKVHGGEVFSDTPCVYGNRIHAEDCAGMLAWLIRLVSEGQGIHPLYLGVDSDPAPLNEVTQWLAEQMNVEPTVSTPVTRASKRCRNDRILESGFSFRYRSFRDGYGELLKEF